MQVMTAEQLTYPVLSLAKDSYLQVHPQPESLTTANARALRRQYFDGMTVIAADGRAFEVVSVVDKRPANGWLGFRFMQPRVFRVKLALSETTPPSLDALRTLVADAVTKDRELWDADGEIDARLTRIRSASTHRELMSSLEWNQR